MRQYTAVEVDKDTSVVVETGEREWEDRVLLGNISRAYVVLHGDTDKLCELHDKLGQLIKHRLDNQSAANVDHVERMLADDAAEIKQIDAPF